MKTKLLFYIVMIVVLISGCASPQATTEAPQLTTAPTVAPPSTTNITIDGDPSDWDRYAVSITDPVGDSTGNVDVKSIRTFTNDRFLYLLVEVEGGIGSYVQLDVDFNPGANGWPEYMANAYPNNQDYIPHVARIENQQFNHLQNTTGEVAQGEAFELRFPLDLFGGTSITALQVRVMDGECCESKWVAVDHTESTQIPQVAEKDASPVASVVEPGSPPVPITFSGEILKDTIWSGEVVLTGDVWLRNGAILTIEPGTIVFLTPDSDDQHCCEGDADGEWDGKNAISIEAVEGTLIANGTEENPIVFTLLGDTVHSGFAFVAFQTQTAAKSGAWDGLRIGKGSSVQNTEIRHANRAIEIRGPDQEEFGESAKVGNGCNIPTSRSYATVSRNHITNVRNSGISISAKAVAMSIDHNTIEGAKDAAISVGNRQSVCIHHNIAKQSGIGIRASGAASVAIYNNLIVDASEGIQVGETADLLVTNNTLAIVQGAPSPELAKGISVFPTEKTVIQNNIVFGPVKWAIGLHEYPTNILRVSYNLFWQVETPYAGKSQNVAKTPVPGMDAGNLSADPMLIDIANDDFHLMEGSPAIDTGAPDVLDADGSPSDIGAYGGPDGGDW